MGGSGIKDSEAGQLTSNKSHPQVKHPPPRKLESEPKRKEWQLVFSVIACFFVSLCGVMAVINANAP